MTWLSAVAASGSAGTTVPMCPRILRVQVTGKVASGSLTARPPRRSFLQWLLRRPVTFG